MNFGIGAQRERYTTCAYYLQSNRFLSRYLGFFLQVSAWAARIYWASWQGEKNGRVGMLLVLARGAGTRKLIVENRHWKTGDHHIRYLSCEAQA